MEGDSRHWVGVSSTYLNDDQPIVLKANVNRIRILSGELADDVAAVRARLLSPDISGDGRESFEGADL